MAKLAEAYGRKVATCEEARRMMKIGTWYSSPEETLVNLGLPPNRKEGEPGFLTWHTDGKRTSAGPMSDCIMAYAGWRSRVRSNVTRNNWAGLCCWDCSCPWRVT